MWTEGVQGFDTLPYNYILLNYARTWKRTCFFAHFLVESCRICGIQKSLGVPRGSTATQARSKLADKTRRFWAQAGEEPWKKGGAHETHPKFHDFRKLDWIRSLTIIIYDDIYEKNTFMSSDMFFTTSPFDSRPAPCGNGTHSIRSSTQLALLRKKGTGFSSPPTIDQRGKEPLDQNMQKQS